jgi:uncharacterized surface protein with fasciclin (FAS1) repeats
MNLTKSVIVAFATLIAATVSIAGPARPRAQMDIVDTAVSAKNFKTLIAAVKAADLVDALKGKGPFTVFAPTDAAFEKLEKSKPGTIAMLLKPENKGKLVAILTYHVVPGKVMAADVLKLKNGTYVKTMNGKSVKVSNKHRVQVNSSTVVKPDIDCSNGVIHVIDTVLLPK